MVTFLQKQYQLAPYIYRSILALFLLPLITSNSPDAIISESIAYPLFLWATFFFFKFLNTHQLKDGALCSIIVFLTCFTRQQYIVCYVVMLMICLYYYFLLKEKKRVAVRFGLISLLSLGSVFMAEKTYHAVYHGHFASTPFVGIQFLIRPLYLASPASVQIAKDPEEKQFLQEAIEALIAEKIIIPTNSVKELNAYHLFYNTICWGISAKIWNSIWSKPAMDEKFKKNHTPFEIAQIIDQKTLDLGLRLTQHNFRAYWTQYTDDVVRGLGEYSFVSLMVFFCLFTLRRYFLSKEITHLHLCTLCAILFHLGNALLVCLFEPSLNRYMYSTGLLVTVMFLILISHSFPSSPIKEQSVCAA